MNKYLDIEGLSYFWGKIKSLFANLANVATSGDYNDLSNKPTIPEGALIVTFTPTGGNTSTGGIIGTADYSTFQIAQEAANGRIVYLVDDGVYAIATFIDTYGEEVDYNVVDGFPNGSEVEVNLGIFYQVGTTVEAYHKAVNNVAFNGETDPIFTASAAHGITSSDITNWNNKTDKVSNPTTGDVTLLDSSGNLVDSGINADDIQIVPSVFTYNNVVVFDSSGYIEDSGISSNNIIQKSLTTGLLKNDGTVDTSTYLTQRDISGKADKVLVASSMPSEGFLPNVVYNLGEIRTNPTFLLSRFTDNTIANIWCWTFSTGTTAPTITWPTEITGWSGGSRPTINASKTYEVSVMNGLATIIES